MTVARAFATVLLLVVTAGVLAWRGLDATSALIELGTFVVAVVAWGIAGPRGRKRGKAPGLLVRDIRARGGDVRVDQSGPDPRVERVDAAREVRVRQRSRDT